MKTKSDFVTNSSSISYIFTSTNDDHSKDKIMLEVDVTELGSVEEITLEILKEIEEHGEYDGENVLFSLSDEEYEYCAQMLSDGKKVFYACAQDDEGPLALLYKSKDINVGYLDGY